MRMKSSGMFWKTPQGKGALANLFLWLRELLAAEQASVRTTTHSNHRDKNAATGTHQDDWNQMLMVSTAEGKIAHGS